MKKNNSTGNDLTGKVPIKHFLLIMRTTFILLFTCVFCSMAEMAHTQNARVTVNNENALDTQQPQRKTVRGKVIDAEGMAVIGANIVEVDTHNGTVTDIDGNYSLSVADDAVLRVSYIGYMTQDINTAGRTNIDVTLQEDAIGLEEFVAVGYGVQKKSVVTAAISSVKSDELGRVAPTRIDNVLKGMVSGVSITQASGQPGDGSRIRIRGVGTINNSEPLYIVDGMPISGGIDYLNPADIESVEILKDAASAAVYGARGANGVILVATKQGQAGKSTLN